MCFNAYINLEVIKRIPEDIFYCSLSYTTAQVYAYVSVYVMEASHCHEVLKQSFWIRTRFSAEKL